MRRHSRTGPGVDDEIFPMEIEYEQIDNAVSRASLRYGSTRQPRSSLMGRLLSHPSSKAKYRIITVVEKLPNGLSYKTDGTQLLSVNEQKGDTDLMVKLLERYGQDLKVDHCVVAGTGIIYDERKELPINDDLVDESMVDDSFWGNWPQNIKVSAQNRRLVEEDLRETNFGPVYPIWMGELRENGDLFIEDQCEWQGSTTVLFEDIFRFSPQGKPIELDTPATENEWSTFVQLNEAFAEKVASIYQPDDIIWIHDYSLMLVPSMLRERLPNACIGFYMRAQYPLSILQPTHLYYAKILKGVIGASLVGFQDSRFAKNFTYGAEKLLGLPVTSTSVDVGKRTVLLRTFPFGFEETQLYQAFTIKRCDDMNVEDPQYRWGQRSVILGCDFLDPVFGIKVQLTLFRDFLSMYPQWRERVVFVLIPNSTHLDLEQRAQAPRVGQDVLDLIARINVDFGTPEQEPVVWSSEILSDLEYFQCLRRADLALFTDRHDTLNGSCLDYILCQDQETGRRGIPIVMGPSRTAHFLRSAVKIDSRAPRLWPRAIKEALEMPEEWRIERHDSLLQYLQDHVQTHWHEHMTVPLVSQHALSVPQPSVLPLDHADLLEKYRAASTRLLVFDYDGTLTPIVDMPSEAKLHPRVSAKLRALAADSKNRVWIVSGRDQQFLSTTFQDLRNLGLSAEHGCFMRAPCASEWTNMTASTDAAWRDAVTTIFQDFKEATPGSWIERKRVGITWHYRDAEAELGRQHASACADRLRRLVCRRHKVEVVEGHMNVEVQPRFVNKGSVVKLLTRPDDPEEEKVDFVLCLGDDESDEAMFRSLLNSRLDGNQVFTCLVGPETKATFATWYVESPSDVEGLLGELSTQT